MKYNTYNFKINKITTNKSEIVPRQINVIIGPNGCGKSRFLKDIKNSLLNKNVHPSRKTNRIIIDNLDFELPKTSSDFIERYNLHNKIRLTLDGQMRISTYSTSNFSDYGIMMNNSISSSFVRERLNVFSEWKNSLEQQVKIFADDVSLYGFGLGDYPDDAEVIDERIIRYKNEEGVYVEEKVAGGGGPAIQKAGESIEAFINTYGELFFGYLGTEEKLMLIKRQEIFGEDDHQTNFLSELQKNPEILQELSKYTMELFGIDIYLDRYTQGKTLVFRVGNDFRFMRGARKDDRSSEEKLRTYPLLDEEGDGIKSFVATFAALHLEDKNILLLDEPETFLHPPLARKLGEIIGETASSEKQIFIATHSPEILKGILLKSEDVNVIRITREDNTNQITQLNHADIASITNDPLLMASNILSGLFCEKVYCTESDADEMFYQAIYAKCHQYGGAYFVHGQNKQTLAKISQVYNKLHIENVRIYDFDVLKKDSFIPALKEGLSPHDRQPYQILRKKVEEFILEKGDEYINKDDALKNLSEDERRIKLKEYCNKHWHSNGVKCLPDELRQEVLGMLLAV